MKDNVNDKYNLNRFVVAQELVYNNALKEIKNGRKDSHWMWYIFPQIEGLGHSFLASHYAIKSREEAIEYINHPVLGPRLIEISEELLKLKSNNASSIFGFPDDLKLKSSMTLFSIVAPEKPVFNQVLKKFFKGDKCKLTQVIIN